MSSPTSTSVSSVLATLNSGFTAAEGAVITGVSSWFGGELLKLTAEEIQQIWNGLNHFLTNIRAGMSWGAAMAAMLTEIWNDEQSDAANVATDFVDAVGKVLQAVGLIASPSAA